RSGALRSTRSASSPLSASQVGSPARSNQRTASRRLGPSSSTTNTFRGGHTSAEPPKWDPGTPDPREEAGEDGGRNELLTARAMLSGFPRSTNSGEGRPSEPATIRWVSAICQRGGRPSLARRLSLPFGGHSWRPTSPHWHEPCTSSDLQLLSSQLNGAESPAADATECSCAARPALSRKNSGLQGFGAGDDLDQLGGDHGLALPIVTQRERRDHVGGVLGGRVH